MIAGHLQEKNGTFYCVLNYVDSQGERKQVWRTTGLPVKGNKKRAEEFLMNLRKTFIIPKEVGDDIDFASDMPFVDFMRQWLDVVRTTVVSTTFGSYQNMVERKFIPYFEPISSSAIKRSLIVCSGIMCCFTKASAASTPLQSPCWLSSTPRP